MGPEPLSVRRLALALFDIGAVLSADSDHPLVIERVGPDGKKERGFKLRHHQEHPDAPLSPIFFNLRTPDNPSKQGLLTPEIFELAAYCMQYVEIGAGLRFDAAVGIPRAGIPFAEAYAELVGVRHFPLDKWEIGDKRHMAGLRSLGDVPAYVKTLMLIDDVVGGAESKLEAIENLCGEKFAVNTILVLIDREEGGRERLERAGCTLYSVFAASELIKLYIETGRMGSEIRSRFDQYLASVNGW